MVHQLLTTGGLDDLILRNTVKNNLPYKLEFDFSDQVSFINNKVARDFVRLYFNTALQNGFKSVYANYQEYEKIRVKIPSLDSLKLSVKCTKFGNVRFCSICSFSEFPLPKKVHYGPEKLQKTRTSAENGVVDQDNSDEDAEIEPAGNPTHGGHARADRMRSVNHDSSQDDCIFERKTRQSHTSKTKVISSKNADFSYSADEHTGDGTSKPIVFLGEDTALPPAISFKSSEYPLLGDILKALSQNRIPCVGITSGEIPRGQLFCWVSGQGRRRYEAAVVVFNGKRYMILEIQQDGFSASMLIMPVYSDEPWAEQMIAQFCAYNGSWAKDGFDNSPHVLLKHAKTRNSYRWAELIMEKIRSFPCS
ncbi:hypothetical protein RFF05_15615 [Bengtsoniella intestinalis]|uniref:hypothetical protein n=1 Tax=Bengtsoniella intestinalis TaxID=3073143 RepID=UPI00391F53F8